jgi:MFS family permease
VAGLFIALWSPAIVLAGPAGILVDRADPRRVLATASVAQAATALALALAVGSTAAVIGLALLLGIGNAFAQPAEFAIAPRLRSDRAIARLNARLETARYAGLAIGPLLGALLAARGGTETALLVDAATFAVIAAVAPVLRTTRTTTQLATREERARDGIAHLRSDRVLRSVLPLAIFALLFMTATATAEVFFAQDVLHAGDTGYGLLMTGWTVGMVLGALLLAPRVGSDRAARVAIAAIAAQGLGIALPAAWPVFAFGLMLYTAGGIAHGLKNVVIRTLIHERTPARLHGRAFAAYNGLRNAAELTALTGGGILVSAVGPRLTIAVAGGVPVLAVLLSRLSRRRRTGSSTMSTPSPTRWLPRPFRGRYRPCTDPASAAASRPGTQA